MKKTFFTKTLVFSATMIGMCQLPLTAPAKPLRLSACTQSAAWNYEEGSGSPSDNASRGSSTVQARSICGTITCLMGAEAGERKDDVILYAAVGSSFKISPTNTVYVGNNVVQVGWWPNVNFKDFTNSMCATMINYLIQNPQKRRV